MAQVRYVVNDVELAIDFYVSHLGFVLEKQFGTAMAIVASDDLQLWLAGPKASASQPMPDGAQPVPGGWNRFVLSVPNLDLMVDDLQRNGVKFRNQIVEGPGGRQILCEDPSGNVIELFQPVQAG